MEEQGVTSGLLRYLKEHYNGHKIIYVRFLNREFIFRTISKSEYKYIMKDNSDRTDIEDAICNISCIYPEEYDFKVCGYAGMNKHVAEIIENLSGFRDVKAILSEYYEAKNISNLETQCMDLIKAFIPEYTYEEMETWTWEKLMKTTVRAECVAKLKGFDYHIDDLSDEYQKELDSINPDDKDFITDLYNHGIDPMFYFKSEIEKLLAKNILDFPLIGGLRWNDEAILDVIRTQIRNKSDRTRYDGHQ